MATTNIRPIKKRLDHVLDYANNESKSLNKDYGKIYSYTELHNVLEYVQADYKTEKRLFVTGINCNSEDAYNQMLITKKNYNKTGGILGYHIIQSFKEGEVTPELAHKIGIEMCEELFGERFEVVVSTHLNTNHYHNHIVLNSVSFKDGKKYYDNNETYSLIRRTSDNLCREYGLSVLKEKVCKGSNINYDNFYKKYSSRNNYQNTAKRDLDLAIAQAFSFDDFKNLMKKLDYEIIFRSGKISIKGKNNKRNIRIERAFGENYSIDNIKKRILEETQIRVPFIEAYKLKKTSNYIKGRFKKSKRKSTGIVALYYHYCFLLKVFPDSKNIKRRLPTSMRAEVNKLENYSNQARFLSKNKIETYNELILYKEKLQSEIIEETSKREKLWKGNSKLHNENEKKQNCNLISDINNEIDLKRKELKLIEDIELRIPKMKENLQELKKEEKMRKEKDKNEYIK